MLDNISEIRNKTAFLFLILLSFPIGLSAQVADSSKLNPITKEFLLGKYDADRDSSFVELLPPFARSKKMYLKKEAAVAFYAMQVAANNDGVNLIVISAFRNFNLQKSVWENKWNGAKLMNGWDINKLIDDSLEKAKKILESTAVPGTSRHHWGTEIDLNCVEESYWSSRKGIKTYNWLKVNAIKFGFCQTYNALDTNRFVGYEEEKWHWSYLPLSSKYVELYAKLITNSDLNGFKGSEYIKQLDIIRDYVLTINPDCKKNQSNTGF